MAVYLRGSYRTSFLSDIQSMAFFMQKIMSKDLNQNKTNTPPDDQELRIRFLIVQKFGRHAAAVFAALENQFEKAINEKTVYSLDLDGSMLNLFLLDVKEIAFILSHELSTDTICKELKKLNDNNFIEIVVLQRKNFVCFNNESVKKFPQFPIK